MINIKPLEMEKKNENGIRSDFNLDGVGQSASCYLPHRVYAYVD
jgi:hypothetical protein